MDSFIFFLEKGFFHILDWNAYEHILFLIVVLVAYSFADFAKTVYLVTAFTLGHLITALLAIYDVVLLGGKYVDFLIPVTIFIFALYNIFTAGRTSNRTRFYIQMMLVLLFGFLHGLGFASYFNSIVGNNNRFVSLLEHSLGIEAAQLVAIVVIVFVGFIFQTVFRFSKRDWVLVISSVVLGLVIPMLIGNKIW